MRHPPVLDNLNNCDGKGPDVRGRRACAPSNGFGGGPLDWKGSLLRATVGFACSETAEAKVSHLAGVAGSQKHVPSRQVTMVRRQRLMPMTTSCHCAPAIHLRATATRCAGVMTWPQEFLDCPSGSVVRWGRRRATKSSNSPWDKGHPLPPCTKKGSDVENCRKKGGGGLR